MFLKMVLSKPSMMWMELRFVRFFGLFIFMNVFCMGRYENLLRF